MDGVKGYPADVLHRDEAYLRIAPGSRLSGVLEEVLKTLFHSVLPGVLGGVKV